LLKNKTPIKIELAAFVCTKKTLTSKSKQVSYFQGGE